MTNYYFQCVNPAFGLSKEYSLEAENYVEVPSNHSAIFCQVYEFPAPMSNREAIVNIVWKVSILQNYSSLPRLNYLTYLTYVANTLKSA